MMKKLVFLTLAAAGLLLAGSCTREELGADNSGDTATISIGLSLENAAQTRAISDGTGADALYYAVYDEYGALVSTSYIVERTSGVTFPTTEAVTLAKGKTYQIAFWAQNSACTAYTLDYGSTTTTDGMTMTVDYDALTNNDEDSDAFFKTVEIYVMGNTSLSVELKRPFAQVNVGVTEDDWNTAVEDGVVIESSAVTFGTVADVLYLLDGHVDVAAAEANLAMNAIPYDATAAEPEYLYVDVTGNGEYSKYVWLAMSYILAPDTTTGSESATTKADYHFYNNDTGDIEVLELVEGLDNLPVQRNWRTNIVGTILSSVVDFNIYIDPDFDGDVSENVADGVVYYETMNTYAISTVKGLEWLSDHVNGADNFGTNDEMETMDFDGYTVVLADDIDLDGVDWVSIGTYGYPFLGTFDGNGNTISNLTVSYSEDENTEGEGDYAGLFGYVGGPMYTGATHSKETTGGIQNLIIKNATVTGHERVAAVAAAAGYCTFSNITVTGDVTIEGYCKVGTVVGEGMYGDITNVIVDVNSGSSVTATRYYADGDSTDPKHSYVGGVIGWGPQYNAVRENIVSNIDVNGADGGVGGISGNAGCSLTFKNCSSSGNVSITHAWDPTDTGNSDKAKLMAFQIGGIAGDYDNENDLNVYFENCSYTGTLYSAYYDGTTETAIPYSLWANKIVGEVYSIDKTNGQIVIDGKAIKVDRSYDQNVTLITVNGTTNVYGIHNLDGLKWVADEVNNNGNTFYGETLMLTDDIDLSSETNWTPIGTTTNPFNGDFDGDGHTISNLTISDSEGSNLGLFGYIDDGETSKTLQVGHAGIKNLTFDTVTITGKEFLGAVVGTANYSYISNVTLTGTVNITGDCFVAGICGHGPYGSVTDITVNVDSGSCITATQSEPASDNGGSTVDNTLLSYAGGVLAYNPTRTGNRENITSNIDVKSADGAVGGISANACGGVEYINCSSSGNIEITAATSTAKDGAIAGIIGLYTGIGTWETTLTSCSFTGTLSTTTKADSDFTGNYRLVGARYVGFTGGTLIIDGEEVERPYNDISVTSGSTWTFTQTDATGTVTKDSNGEYYLDVAPGTSSDQGRADIQLASSTDPVILDPAYPVLCLRITNLNDESGYSAHIQLDTNDGYLSTNTTGNKDYSGSIGNGDNQYADQWYCEDGTQLLIYNVVDQGIGTLGALSGRCSFNTFQIKYANITKDGSWTAGDATYKFYWLKSFASTDALAAYLTQNGLAYSKTAD